MRLLRFLILILFISSIHSLPLTAVPILSIQETAKLRLIGINARGRMKRWSKRITYSTSESRDINTILMRYTRDVDGRHTVIEGVVGEVAKALKISDGTIISRITRNPLLNTKRKFLSPKQKKRVLKDIAKGRTPSQIHRHRGYSITAIRIIWKKAGKSESKPPITAAKGRKIEVLRAAGHSIDDTARRVGVDRSTVWRRTKGVKSGAYISDEKKGLIRDLASMEGATQSWVAEAAGVSQSSVSMIVRGKR